jgi:antitoxin component of RelBE/YafQ-DinJ toxin-antitoxin module
MSKLTLSVDDAVISRAKRYAKKQGISVSKMVEGYLAAVAEPVTRPTADTPVLRSVRGVLKKADLRDYKRHLAEKYRPPNKHR